LYRHDFSNPPLFLPEAQRIIFIDYSTNSAVILFPTFADLKLPNELVELRPVNSDIAIGVELGWLGFPALAPYTLLFFSRNVSARQADRKAYLIDGVAIPGVSGGPVIFSSVAEGCQFIGAVSAYVGARSVAGAFGRPRRFSFSYCDFDAEKLG
jgi:hypothetical protein